MDIQPARLFPALNALYLPTLQNRNVAHPKLLVLFSGPPSSGKSTVARAIETKFEALRIEYDVLRTLIMYNFPDLGTEQRDDLAYWYTKQLSDRLVTETINGLWVIDASVDRRFDEFAEFASKHSFATFLIAMNIPESVHREWIVSGGDRPFNSAAVYLERMQQRRSEQAQFLRHHKPDLILDPDYKIDTLFGILAHRLKKLRARA